MIKHVRLYKMTSMFLNRIGSLYITATQQLLNVTQFVVVRGYYSFGSFKSKTVSRIVLYK